MGYAPHTNQDVQYQLAAGIVPTTLPMIFGQFREKDHGYTFEYAERRGFPDTFAPEMPHMIYVGNGETRLAKVMKTVAWIVIDEDEKGEPVYVQWKIKNHNIYNTEWVRA